jgi:hypothetical protein
MGKRHNTSLLFEIGLRYDEKANAPGGQTERRGEAGPVSVLLRGWGLTGRFAFGRTNLAA